MPKPTVLLVDDEERALFGLGHVLREGGYSLRFAATPAEALCILASEPVAAVVSDHLMPGMTGLELLAAVRNRHPGVARLMLSGHADAALGRRALREGLLHGFLQKPCDRREVQATVKAAVKLALEVEALLGPARERGSGPLQERDWPGLDGPARRKA